MVLETGAWEIKLGIPELALLFASPPIFTVALAMNTPSTP